MPRKIYVRETGKKKLRAAVTAKAVEDPQELRAKRRHEAAQARVGKPTTMDLRQVVIELGHHLGRIVGHDLGCAFIASFRQAQIQQKRDRKQGL